MPRQRQVEVNEATSSKIKATARQLMAAQGSAGLSLRAIARMMDLTAPALYHYFASLDELITALIVDAFTSHATYVRQARDCAANAGQPYSRQLFAATQAYRAWALENPQDFGLVYGNPIPGYVAPTDTTTPAARSIGAVFLETLVAAAAAGDFAVPQGYRQIPPTVLAHYQQNFGMDDTTSQIFHLMNYMWGMIHGLVSLEIYNHAAPVVGDTDAFFAQAMRQLLTTVGVNSA